MSEDPLLIACENIWTTYVRLASGAPGTTLKVLPSHTIAEGNCGSVLCNFAIKLNLNAPLATALYEAARKKPSFCVYQCSVDQPAHLEALLLAAGFECSYVLDIHNFHSVIEPYSNLEPKEAVTSEERSRVAKFMVDQFFTRGKAGTSTIVHATATGDDLRLFSVSDLGGPYAAIMLSETPGSVGIYNLCVAPDRRGQGIGRALTIWAASRALDKGKFATLQCDAMLSRWNRMMGSETVGKVNIWRAA